MEKADNI